MPKPQPITFTEPTQTELLAVTEAELQIATFSMLGVSDAYRAYVQTPKGREVKPCLRRVR